MEVTLSRKWAKSRTRGRKLHSTGPKTRGGRPRKTRADLEQQLKACKRKLAHAREGLAEAIKQQTATSEVMRIISSSPVQSVLDMVAENAARLCEANNAEIFRLENDLLHLVASYGEIPVHVQARKGLPTNRDTVIGRAIRDRRTIQVRNLAVEESEFPAGSSNAKREGHRTTLATPLLRGDAPIGVILMRRWEIRPFSAKQIALLENFADQAVIAIENARLFEAERQRTLALAHVNRDLAEREAKIRRLVDSNIIGIFIWDFDGHILEANDAFLRIVNYNREDLVSGRILWTELTPPDWRDRNNLRIEMRKSSGHFPPFEKEYTRKDGTRVPVLMGGATIEEGGNQGVAYVLDLTERKRAEERLRVQHIVAQILAEAATVEEATLRVLQAIGECLVWDVGVLWRVDLKGEALRCVELWHRASIEVPEFESVSRKSTFVPGLGLPGRVWSSLEPEYVPDVVPDENFARGPIAEREELHAALAFPILIGGEALGVIEFFSREIRQPDQELLNVLATIGSQIGQFIERKHGEEALRQSEAKFRDYAETASDWLWEIGPDYKFTLLTENAFGSNAADRIGTACWDHALDLETEPEKWRLVRATLDARKPFRDFIYRGLSGDGSPMHVRASGKPAVDANGEFRGYRGTATDVTALMRAQEALRESERSSRSAIDGIAGLVQILAPNGEVETVNRQLLEYFRRSLEWLKNWETNDAVHPEDLPRVLVFFNRGITSGIPFNQEFRIRRFDGEYRWFEVRAVPVRDDAGHIARWYVLLTDIEDRTRALARLDQMQSDLAHMNRLSMMGELAASLAHEIAQPIATARNNARAAMHFLDRSPLECGQIREAISCVVDDADRAGNILERIRDQIKKAPPRKESVDFNQAIYDVIALARGAIVRNGVSVQTRLAEGIPHVQADLIQVQQVVLNLILNAVEAMGSIEDGVRELSIITERHEAGEVLVTVSDSGPGIDRKHLDRVFDAFYTTKSSGAGMGLAICRSIIDAHGGRLWASANEARGASFLFTLPSAETNS
jgi:PAS domain S-box-containing protein